MGKDLSVAGTSTPRRWAGSALLFIVAIHTALGILVGLRWLPDPQMDRLAGSRIPLLELTPGFGSLPEVDLLPLVMFWFLFFGFALIPLGFLVRHLERKGESVPSFVGIQLIILGLAGGILLPASGFWTVLVPAWNILRKRKSEGLSTSEPSAVGAG